VSAVRLRRVVRHAGEELFERPRMIDGRVREAGDLHVADLDLRSGHGDLL